MRTALTRKVPSWVVENLGRRVQLRKPCEGYAPMHRGLLVMIDSGIDESGKMKGSGSSWRGQSRPVAVVALDENDLSDLSNVDFDDIEPVPAHR